MPYKNIKDRRAQQRRWRRNNPEKAKEHGRKWKAKNPDKMLGYSNKWNRLNPEGVHRKRIKYLYGITTEQYDNLLKSQDGKCAICNSPGNGIRLDVDHCHETKAIRGLLCRKCNQGIGLLGNNTGRLASAIDYLTPKLSIIRAA